VTAPTIAASYCDVVLGARPGFLAVAFGQDGYWDEGGKYKHPTGKWTERRYRWPGARGALDTDITRMTLAGDRVDVYACPVLRFTDDRRKGSALPPMVCWADLDTPPADDQLLAKLDPFTVESGTDGHRHVYLPLTAPVDLGTHARLNRALATRLGGDAKWSDESLLRLPGTLNHKAEPPTPVQPLPWSGRVWDPDELVAVLGVTAAPSTAGHNDDIRINAENPPEPLPSRVQAALNHADTADRSQACMRVVAACADTGLTPGQALTVLSRYGPAERYNNAKHRADDVARIYRKVTTTTMHASSAAPIILIDQLLKQLRVWQDLPDPTHIYVALALAVAVTATGDGEPAWLLIVAPPSSGKTETVRILDDITVKRLDEVTVAGLLSWTKRGKTPTHTGVLTKVTRGLVTFGDLSTLLATSDKGRRDQIFAMLRRIYDGEIVRDVGAPSGAGTDGPLAWNGRLTIVGAVTGAIDTYSAHADQLGARWLYCRIPDRDTTAKRRAAALARNGDLDEHRERARQTAVTDHILEPIEDAALVCCWGRATVPRHGYGAREIDGPVTIEEPMRVVRQLGTVTHGLLALGCTPHHTADICRRLALDSMPAVRRAVLEALATTTETNTSKIARDAGLNRKVTRRVLEDLEAIGVVTSRREATTHDPDQPEMRECLWTLNGDDGDLISRVIGDHLRGGCSEKREPTPQPPNKDTSNDTEGTGGPLFRNTPKRPHEPRQLPLMPSEVAAVAVQLRSVLADAEDLPHGSHHPASPVRPLTGHHCPHDTR
jgi:hypothetical protein